MKVSVFIDGNNFYHGLRYIYGKEARLKMFDYKGFIDYLLKDREVSEIFYYNAELDKSKNQEKFKSQKEFFNNLKKIPKFNLILCKLLKRKIKGTNKFYYVLKEDDIHMAVDIVEGACEDNFDVAILVSGDGDFVPAVRAVQKRSKIVENIYFKKSSSRNLKQHCNKSLELTKEILDNFSSHYQKTNPLGLISRKSNDFR
ncbi:NYN domain-containing protein [Candidatus Pacearchaeota archaeon]|nr:NYN domain-containing protein [Candidatus Pacearchaeota archaeon]